MEINKKYIVTGNVLGNCWGGGLGIYTSKIITGNTLEEVIQLANKMLEDGSLDAGMGFESLIGAMLYIEVQWHTIIDGLSWYREEVEVQFIGNLTQEQIDLLLQE